MKKLIVTMGLLSTIALPLSMVACSSKVETNISNDYGFKVGDVVSISFINSTSDYSTATITRIDNIGIMVNNATFIPWTAIKTIYLCNNKTTHN